MRRRLVIYLDYNAATPVAPQVLEVMASAVRSPGNPSSPHRWGQRARVSIDEVRVSVRELVGGAPWDVVFTSGGTEADNLAVSGWIREGLARGRHRVLCSAVEHPAVWDAARALGAEGVQVERIPVLSSGLLDLEALRTTLDEDVALVAVMLANNESGVIQPISEVAAMAASQGARFHCDAVQGVGKISIKFSGVAPDSVALSAHKFGGPKGVGALLLKKGASLGALWGGGGQEQGVRSGSEATALIAGMGCAAQLASQWNSDETRVSSLRNHFEEGLEAISGVSVVGATAPRLPGTSAICFHGLKSHQLVTALDEAGICASGGAACHSGGSAPSAVMLAMGLSEADAAGTVRFSFGHENTLSEIDEVLLILTRIVWEMREMT